VITDRNLSGSSHRKDKMTAHLQYLRYVARHKWFVFVACCRLLIPWRGVTHDWHKFLPSEWFAYVRIFYGKGGNKPAFDQAWLRHQNRADHHWQWWILINDKEMPEILPMSSGALFEMLADWYGASRAQGHGGWPAVREWYQKNRGRITLNPQTRDHVEFFLERQR